jgi:hypothetical protein
VVMGSGGGRRRRVELDSEECKNYRHMCHLCALWMSVLDVGYLMLEFEHAFMVLFLQHLGFRCCWVLKGFYTECMEQHHVEIQNWWVFL